METLQKKGFDYLRESLQNYLDRVSAKTPAPGGGSVTACSASLSLSLLNMVLNYTIGNKKYIPYQIELEAIKNETDRILKKLSQYIEKDSEVYGQIRRYSSGVKNHAYLEKYLKQSVEIHLDICKVSLRIVDLSDVLTVKGNRSLISDTGIAVSLAVASFNSAKLNILINLKFIADRHFVKNNMDRVATMENEVVAKGDAVYKKVEGILKGE
jgi:methenyltetrahydrofolate cyclohydrolase